MMTRKSVLPTFSILLLFVSPNVSQAFELLRFSDGTIEKAVSLNDVRIIAADGESGGITVRTGTKKRWPGIALSPVDGRGRFWNLAGSLAVATEINNLDDEPLVVHLRIDNPAGTDGRPEPWITAKTTIPGGQSGELRAVLRRKGRLQPGLIGMQTYPQGVDSDGIDATRISGMRIFVRRNESRRTFSIGPLRAVGEYDIRSWERLTNDTFYPFVDEFGQFRHADWPGKARANDTLDQQRIVEEADLEKNPGRDDRNRFGGWQPGPELRATGRFRVEKLDGKWWFIDPEGRLFWSHGIGVVRPYAPTVVTDREHYFEPSIAGGRAGIPFFTKLSGSEVSSGHFVGRDSLLTYDFAASNLQKKYGPAWEDTIVDTIFLRLRSWGINTLGLWSYQPIKSRKRIPYTEWLYYKSPTIAGKGNGGKAMVDMWHPDFEIRLRSAAKRLDVLKNDPWLIGVFVDNELPWGDASSFLGSVLRSPAGQPAKNNLVEHLRKKYETIESLNASWGTGYSSWAALLNATHIPVSDQLYSDASSYMSVSAERYYKTVATVIAEKSADILYLCSRFNGRFPVAERAAARHCDIISYNLYRKSVREFSAVDALDVPVLISEWHFGATDRGLFGAGLVAVDTQKDRADSYTAYATGALENPKVVGVHWFQYLDEPVTGRPLDGENYQIGFVSITDHPYPEIVRASRDVGEKLYETRYSSK